MADIMMCSGYNLETGVECTRKAKCYRNTAQMSDNQTLFVDPPFMVTRNGDQDCEYFWDNTSGTRIKDD